MAEPPARPPAAPPGLGVPEAGGRVSARLVCTQCGRTAAYDAAAVGSTCFAWLPSGGQCGGRLHLPPTDPGDRVVAGLHGAARQQAALARQVRLWWAAVVVAGVLGAVVGVLIGLWLQ